MKEITDVIATVGFPIVALGFISYYGGRYFIGFVNRIMDENKVREENMYKFMDNMSEQMEKMSLSMENLGNMMKNHVEEKEVKSVE